MICGVLAFALISWASGAAASRAWKDGRGFEAVPWALSACLSALVFGHCCAAVVPQ